MKSENWRGERAIVLLALAVAAIVAYLPTLRQPFIEDDYPNLAQSAILGAPAAWRELAASVFRLRATSTWMMYAAWHAFGLHPAPYYALAIALHVLNTWLVYALGRWPALGHRVSAWAALFFAVYEGHQEAVMWFSASNELLQFLFGVGAFLCWLIFLERRRWAWYAGALVLFVLALLSKESAVVFALLFALPLKRRRAPWLLPFLALAAVAAYSVYGSRGSSFRFQDNSFVLSARFWLVWPLNMARLLWFWGALGIAAAVWKHAKVVALGLAWAGISLLPYSFLTYSTQIPSRQLYLASAGVAWIVGAGFVAVSDAPLRSRLRWVFPVIAAILVLHNVGYLWIKKRRQFLERAAPTEQLIAFARRTNGPIYVRCFPRNHYIAEEAVHLGAGKAPSDLVWDAADARARGAAATFCYQRK